MQYKLGQLSDKTRRFGVGHDVEQQGHINVLVFLFQKYIHDTNLKNLPITMNGFRNVLAATSRKESIVAASNGRQLIYLDKWQNIIPQHINE